MPPAATSPPRAPLVAAAAGIGALVAVQTAVNGDLAGGLGGGTSGGVAAAVVSFGTGWLLLCGVCLLVPSGRRGLLRVARAVRNGALQPWQVLGGTAGALLVATQGVTVPTIGVAVFTVALVAGQTCSGLAVDSVGLSPSGVQRVTVARGVGAAVTVLAVAVTVSSHLGSPSGLLLALLPLVTGMLAAWQQAVNGHVSLAARSPLSAAWVNFTVGLGMLGLLSVVGLLASGGVHRPALPGPDHWWLYTGGVLGIVFIAVAATLVRHLGVLLLGLCTVAGQVVAALLLDAGRGGWSAVAPATVLGAVLALAGVVVASAGRRRAARRPAATLG